METSKKTYQSVEGIKIYKTRKYVQDEKTKQNCETRRLRDQYLKDHKEEILKLKHNQRIKKANELLKQDLNLNVNYNTLYSALKKSDYIVIDNNEQQLHSWKEVLLTGLAFALLNPHVIIDTTII